MRMRPPVLPTIIVPSLYHVVVIWCSYGGHMMMVMAHDLIDLAAIVLSLLISG